MSSTSQPTSFLDLYTATLNAVRGDTANAAAIVKAKRYVNQGAQDVKIQQAWPWDERRGRVITHATYTTGTATTSITTRTAVTGTDTLWNTAVSGYGFTNARAGGKIRFAGSTDPYLVSTVTSDTALTLGTNWIGATALSGVTYTYYEDEYALASDFSRLVDARVFSTVHRIAVIGRSDFYRRFPKNTETGTPEVCTLLDLAPSASVARQPRVLFHPAPSTVLQIEYRYVTTNVAVSSAGAEATELSADTDQPLMPLRFRHVLVHYAAWQWARDLKDDTRAGEHQAAYVDLVARMANDANPERDVARLIVPRQVYGPMRRSSRFITGAGIDRWERGE